MNILVTGSQGFIGLNLLEHLRRMENVLATGLSRNDGKEIWERRLDEADIVFHLAGSNRPPDPAGFQKDNHDLTRFITDRLEISGHYYKLIFSSSIQATQDNPYGKSKKDAEDYISDCVKKGSALIYRLPNVFGKWGRPNYNSVVATYCYNTARNLPLQIRDPDYKLRLVYIDDVVRSFLTQIQNAGNAGVVEMQVDPEYSITLGALAETIRSFGTNRKTLFIPDMGDGLLKSLYSTWLSYLPTDEFSYGLDLKTDPRGSLFELLKSRNSGQIFISTTKPGVTRGNHYHHSKTEKFVVIEGNGRIQFRSLIDGNIIEYVVDGTQPKVVDIPPGYTHNITNTGDGIMVTLFWANEVFDPLNPDTFFEKV